MDALVKEAIAFVSYFGYPIAQSAPHIYLSALPFTPSSSIISKLYSPRFNTMRVEKGRLTKWPALEMSIATPHNSVDCVAWSRNGEYIAAGLRKDVYVWSTSTGMRVSGPFRIENCVGSIGFSYDGHRLAVGDWEGRIWIWDVMKEEHTEVQGTWTRAYVSAVAFGEDDRQLVLGLHDGGVWVWDLKKAELVGDAFIWHNNPVWAVSFLDEKHIVSRSGSRTVQVWNVKTRESVTRMDMATGTINPVLKSKHSNGFTYNGLHANSRFDMRPSTEATEREEKYRDDRCDWVLLCHLMANSSPHAAVIISGSGLRREEWQATLQVVHSSMKVGCVWRSLQMGGGLRLEIGEVLYVCGMCSCWMRMGVILVIEVFRQ